MSAFECARIAQYDTYKSQVETVGLEDDKMLQIPIYVWTTYIHRVCLRKSHIDLNNLHVN